MMRGFALPARVLASKLTSKVTAGSPSSATDQVWGRELGEHTALILCDIGSLAKLRAGSTKTANLWSKLRTAPCGPTSVPKARSWTNLGATCAHRREDTALESCIRLGAFGAGAEFTQECTTRNGGGALASAQRDADAQDLAAAQGAQLVDAQRGSGVRSRGHRLERQRDAGTLRNCGAGASQNPTHGRDRATNCRCRAVARRCRQALRRHQLRRVALRRICAKNGIFTPKKPFLARTLTRIGAICTARRDGADCWGPRPGLSLGEGPRKGGGGWEGLAMGSNLSIDAPASRPPPPFAPPQRSAKSDPEGCKAPTPGRSEGERSIRGRPGVYLW